jgi:4-cresol dehydrogenase (hydroxylating)
MWNCVGALYGTKLQVAAGKKIINAALAGKVSKLNYISEFRLRLLEKYQGLFSLLTGMNIPEMVKVLRPSFGILSGIPNEVALATPYWRSKKTPPSSGRNCAKDNCGVIWLSPVIPMTSNDVALFRKAIEPIFAKHGFDCCITLTTVTSRSFDSTIPILYNRDNVEETKKADACYHELLEALLAAGYIPYRFGIQSMGEISGRRDVYWDTIETLKDALDPKRILAPGRYCRQ